MSTLTAPSFWSALLRPERPRGGGRGSWFTVVGLVLVPLTIGGLLTWALWKPSERLDRMTAAVVNTDTGLAADGSSVYLGRMLAGGLVTSSGTAEAPDGAAASVSGHGSTTNLTWEITNAPDAKAGLASGRYVAVVTIGKDFSADATSWADPSAADVRQAQVTLQTSPRARPLDAVITGTVTHTASQVLGVTLTQTYVDGVLTGFTTMGTELGAASDGADQVALGAGALADGASELAAGADLLAVGAGQLTIGAGSLVTGTVVLAAATRSLAAGVHDVSDGSAELAGGLGQLASQTSSAASAAQQGVPTAAQLADALDQLSAAVNGSSPGDPSSLSGGVSALSAGASGVATGAHAAAGGANDLAGGLGAANQGLDTFLATAAGLTQACQADPSPGGPCQQLAGLIASQQAGNPAGLADTMASLRGGAASVSTNLGTLGTAADQVATGAATLDATVNTGTRLPDGTVVPALTTTTASLAAGGGTLVGALAQTATGLAELDGYVQQSAHGAATLASGASAVASGADQLASGANDTASGTSQLFNGTSELAGGAGGLADGTRELADGVAELAPGTADLAEGLRTATGTIPSYTADQAGQVASVIAQPVVTTGGDLDLFGSSVVPYFMVLALWLGGLAAYLVLSPRTPRALASTSSSWRLALRSFAPAAAVGVVQGVALSAILAPPLGLSWASWLKVAVVAAGVAVAFAAVNQGLAAAFGQVGRYTSAVVATVALAAAVVSTIPQPVVDLYAASPLGPALACLQDAAGSGGMAGAVLLLLAWTLAGLSLTTAALARHRVVPARTLARWVRAGT
ncbi:MAG: hypothetical protein FWF21_03755 [Micrococcales bacterium]|nr:hypothetical protein [Micrococcales bacterium]